MSLSAWLLSRPLQRNFADSWLQRTKGSIPKPVTHQLLKSSWLSSAKTLPTLRPSGGWSWSVFVSTSQKDFSGNSSTASCVQCPWNFFYLALQKAFPSEAASGDSKAFKAHSSPIHSTQTGLQSCFWTSFSPWDLSTRNISSKMLEGGKNVGGASGRLPGPIFQVSRWWESPLPSLASRGQHLFSSLSASLVIWGSIAWGQGKVVHTAMPTGHGLMSAT